MKPRVTDNFEALNTELSETEAAILKFEEIVRHLMQKLSGISETIHRLTSDLQLICNSHELIHIIDELDTDKYHKLEIADKAFKRFEKMGSREVSD